MLNRIVSTALWLSISAGAFAQDTRQPAGDRGQPSDRLPVFSAAEVRQNWRTLQSAVSLTGQDANARRIGDAVNALSDTQLERVYGDIDMSAMIQAFDVAEQAMDAVDRANYPGGKSLKEVLASSSMPGFGPLVWKRTNPNDGGVKFTVGFPNAQGYPGAECPFSPDRSNADDLLAAVDAIQGARVGLEAAEVLWSGLSRACDETVVVLGEGGNTSLACIPADIALFAAELVVGVAESVVEHLQFCDAAVDAAEIEGSYERAGHIHDDLSLHATEIASQLATHDTAISTQLATHDTDISNQLATHDTDISNQLAQHDADIKQRLGEIQGTVDENQRLIRILMSRQLEVLRLLLTPEGRRVINSLALTCTGADCPQALECADGGLSWPCR